MVFSLLLARSADMGFSRTLARSYLMGFSVGMARLTLLVDRFLQIKKAAYTAGPQPGAEAPTPPHKRPTSIRRAGWGAQLTI